MAVVRTGARLPLRSPAGGAAARIGPLVSGGCGRVAAAPGSLEGPLRCCDGVRTRQWSCQWEVACRRGTSSHTAVGVSMALR